VDTPARRQLARRGVTQVVASTALTPRSNRNMPPSDDRIPEETARAIWRRAAQLQAEAERRLEENSRRIPSATGTDPSGAPGLHPDDVRAAGGEAGISPEFVQIAMAETAASNAPSSPLARWDVLGARLFLGATRHTIEATATVQANVPGGGVRRLLWVQARPAVRPGLVSLDRRSPERS
jgi:hypothetical protein